MPEQRLRPEQRSEVRERALYCCEYCRSQDHFSTQSFTADHIVPRSKDGPTSLGNLAWACGGCNGGKYDKVEGLDPVNSRPAPLFDPRRQSWNDHFRWSADCALIIGKTRTGRATVEALDLNRDSLLDL